MVGKESVSASDGSTELSLTEYVVLHVRHLAYGFPVGLLRMLLIFHLSRWRSRSRWYLVSYESFAPVRRLQPSLSSTKRFIFPGNGPGLQVFLRSQF